MVAEVVEPIVVRKRRWGRGAREEEHRLSAALEVPSLVVIWEVLAPVRALAKHQRSHPFDGGSVTDASPA